MSEEKCERCEESFSFTVDGKTYTHKTGVKIPGVYDGILVWKCPWCSYVWHRWPEGSRLREKALPYVSKARV